MTMYFQFPRSPELSRYFRASILQSRATEWQKRIDAGFARGPGAWDPRKDFSQCMQQSIILSTSNVISPLQERTEPSGRRSSRRGVKSSPRREQDQEICYVLNFAT